MRMILNCTWILRRKNGFVKNGSFDDVDASADQVFMDVLHGLMTDNMLDRARVGIGCRLRDTYDICEKRLQDNMFSLEHGRCLAP